MENSLCWCVEGEVGELVQPAGSKWGLPWGLLCGTSGRRKLSTVSSHSCHIYGIWRSKEVGGHVKVIISGGNASRKGGTIFMGKGGFHHIILMHWNFIVSPTGCCKSIYRIIPLFPTLLLFYLFCKAKSAI